MTARLSFILCLLLLYACSPPPQPLRVAAIPWPGYEALFLARAQGHLDPFAVHLVEMESATSVLHELRNGTVDAAALTLDETLSAIAQGVPLAVVLVLDISDGADALLARPGIERLDELRGRKVGVETSALGALMLQSALEAGGLKPSDVVVVPLTVDSHERAFERGEIDAVVTFEPVRSRLLRAGARLLFDSRQIPGRIIDVLAVRTDRVADHATALEHLLRAWFRALAFQRNHPERAARLMQPRLRLEVEAILAAFDGIEQPDAAANRSLLSGSPAPLDERARELARFMAAHGLLPTDFSPPPLAIDRFLPAPP
ncbi:MAG: hypothetical protein D6786_08240 [Gammaproteobacteria bacterium]|nr:MAG: hypothetical protein D6786_08240 [Gammaproteobacteria bacterium]